MCSNCGWDSEFYPEEHKQAAREWLAEQGVHVREEYQDPGDCPDCGHDWNLHGDRYGCCYERGDNLAGTAALPPCGCKKVKGGAR